MRHTFLIFLLVTGSIHTLFAQEPEKLKKYQSTVSKHTYSKGDTLVVGEAGKNVFRAKPKYTGIFIKDKKNVCGYRELDSIIAGTSCIIKNILSFQEHCSYDFKNSVIFELQGTGDQTYYMQVDKALQAKELIVYVNPRKAGGFDLLDDRALLLLNLDQFKGTSADNALKYCKLVDPAKGKEYELNPKQFEKDKAEWTKKLEEARKTVHLKDTFVIYLPAYLGKYAFDRNEFQVVDNPAVFGSKPLKYSNETKILFDNFKSFIAIKSGKEQADFFQNTNIPDYNGNRKAYAQIKAICTSINKDPAVIPSPDNPGSNIFHFTIFEVSMVDSENQNYNYIGMKKVR